VVAHCGSHLDGRFLSPLTLTDSATKIPAPGKKKKKQQLGARKRARLVNSSDFHERCKRSLSLCGDQIKCTRMHIAAFFLYSSVNKARLRMVATKD
jgi:hypothetical protein